MTEFDPNAILGVVSEDINDLINRACAYVNTGQLDSIEFALPKTFAYVQNEMSNMGVLLNKETALAYGSAIESVAKQYVLALSSYPYWYSRHARWMGAQYSSIDPKSVDVILDLSDSKFPELERQDISDALTPKLLEVMEILLGSLGGKM